MPDIEKVTVFRHCIRMFANLRRRYAAKKLAECARESRRWQENLNWQIQGCTVVATHLDNLHATVGRPLHLDKAKWNVYNFRSRTVSSQTAELPSCVSSLPHRRKRKRGGKKVAHARFANTQLSRTCSLTPPSNRLSFMTRGSRCKPRRLRLWFRLLFCWGSLPVVPPLPRRHQRLAATNCSNFLTTQTPTLLK